MLEALSHVLICFFFARSSNSVTLEILQAVITKICRISQILNLYVKALRLEKVVGDTLGVVRFGLIAVQARRRKVLEVITLHSFLIYTDSKT